MPGRLTFHPGTSLIRRSHPKLVSLAVLLSIVLLFSGVFHPSSLRRPNRDVHNSRSVHVPLEAPRAVKTVTVHRAQRTVTVTSEVVVPTARSEAERLKVPPQLKGPPTLSFKDNLQPNIQYITSWQGSGFTNDLITYINLIYLGLLTQRVPILSHFSPSHIARGTGFFGGGVDFWDVFDVPRYIELTGQPLLEWWQVKNSSSETIDPLGCWNLWQAVDPQNAEPHWSPGPYRLKLDISYTTAPKWIRFFHTDNLHMRFSSIMSLGFPKMRKSNLRKPAKSKKLEVSLPPDEQVLCYDNLYWAVEVEAHEWAHDYSSPWRQVGQYLHFNPKVEDLARQYLRRMFNLDASDPVPPFIAIHVRHGDFLDWCPKERAASDCFAPLSAYARRVRQMQAALLSDRGITVADDHIVITSDESDAAWWDAALAYGWARPDHAAWGTEKDPGYGLWTPLLIDAAIQSMASGLVGTKGSTVSMIAGKRVKAWNNGLERMVRWGHPGADEEEP